MNIFEESSRHSRLRYATINVISTHPQFEELLKAYYEKTKINQYINGICYNMSVEKYSVTGREIWGRMWMDFELKFTSYESTFVLDLDKLPNEYELINGNCVYNCDVVSAKPFIKAIKSNFNVDIDEVITELILDNPGKYVQIDEETVFFVKRAVRWEQDEGGYHISFGVYKKNA